MALCAVVAALVAALSGGPAPSAGALPTAATATATASASASASAGAATGKGGSTSSATLTGATTPRLIVPDVIASVPGGVTAADLARLRKLSGVRAVLELTAAASGASLEPRTENEPGETRDFGQARLAATTSAAIPASALKRRPTAPATYAVSVSMDFARAIA